MEKIFYDEDGNFIPLTGKDGNTDWELSYLRDTYMKSEREYFLYLLSIDKIREAFLSYFDYSSEDLFGFALQYQEKLEYGMLEDALDLKMIETMTPSEKDAYHMKKLEEAEGMICLLFAAAKDKVKILELVKTYEIDNKKDLYEETNIYRSR